MTTTENKKFYPVIGIKRFTSVHTSVIHECPVPISHSRIHDEWVALETFRRVKVIGEYKRYLLGDEDILGKDIIFQRNVNKGNKKFTDNRTDLFRRTVSKVTEKSFLTNDGMRVSREDDIIIGE